MLPAILSKAHRVAALKGSTAILLAAAAACAAHEPGPRAITAAPAGASAGARATRDYAVTLAAIVDTFERDFRLPRVEVMLQLYPSRRQFQQGLVESGYTPALARSAAANFHAIGGAKTMMVNESELEQYPWDQQVRLIAHEAAHSVQYQLAGGGRGTSEQWLREGFADYVACRAAARLGYGSLERQRDAVLASIAVVAADSKPAPFSQLRSFAQWTSAQTRYDLPLYAQAFIAAEMLIDDKGLEAALRYFSLSRPGADPQSSFAAAFGLSLRDFESAFGQRWLRVLVERGRRDSN